MSAQNPTWLSRTLAIKVYKVIDMSVFTGKSVTRKFRSKLHPGYEWHIFHIFTSEDIDDVTFNVFPLKSIAFVRVFVYIIKRKLYVA